MTPPDRGFDIAISFTTPDHAIATATRSGLADSLRVFGRGRRVIAIDGPRTRRNASSEARLSRPIGRTPLRKALALRCVGATIASIGIGFSPIP